MRKGGQWELAVQLLEEMIEAGVTPNTITYSSAIESLPFTTRRARTVAKQAIVKGVFQVWNKRGELDRDMTAASANAVLDTTLHEIASGERSLGDLLGHHWPRSPQWQRGTSSDAFDACILEGAIRSPTGDHGHT